MSEPHVGEPAPKSPHEARAPVVAAAAKRTLWALIAVETLCVLGTEIGVFGVAVWIYESTHSVYSYGWQLFASTVPGLLISPLAGHVVDKYPRKRVMIGAMVVTLLGSLLVLLAAVTNHINMIPLLLGAAIASMGEAFQWPALAATLPRLAPRKQLHRFNGLLESGKAASVLMGPVIGGAMFALVGLRGLIGVELATFVVGAAVVATLHIPNAPLAPPVDAEAEGDDKDEEKEGEKEGEKEEEGEDEVDDEEEESLSWADLLFGVRWILRRKQLVKLLAASVFANFFLSIGNVLMAPYCLGMVSERAFGIAGGCFGAGMIVGGIVYGRLGDRFKNAHIFLVSVLVLSVLYTGYGFARSLPSLAAIEFGVALLATIANSANLTIWQLKVPDEASGRVLSTMFMIDEATTPISFLLAGPIGDTLVPYLLGHAGAASGFFERTWGATKSGQIGTLFTTIGLVLFVGFSIAARSKDVRGVDACEV